MNTNLLRRKFRHKADKPTAIYDLTVYKMWEPQHLTTLWASTGSYKDTFTYFTITCERDTD
jgi:hypothetical protein